MSTSYGRRDRRARGKAETLRRKTERRIKYTGQL